MKEKTEKRKTLPNLSKLMKLIDTFGEKIEVTVNGEPDVRSTIGGVFSIFYYFLMIAYTAYRFYLVVT